MPSNEGKWARMPTAKKAWLMLSASLLLSALVCDLIGWHIAVQARLWRNIGEGLMGLSILANLFITYHYGSNVPAPNPLIGLFPKPQQSQEDEPQ